MDMQRTEIIGHLSQTAEVEYLPSGQPVASFAVGCNTRYTGADGQPKEDVLFMDCKVYGKRAEKLGPHLEKGKKILVAGRLKQNRWEKDGQKHSRIELLVNQVLFLSPKDPNGVMAESEMASSAAQ